jgi:hypothetical protein
MTEGRIVKTQQNPLFFRLYLLGSGGCQPLLAVSLNQRVQGSSPCAPTIETIEVFDEIGTGGSVLFALIPRKFNFALPCALHLR